MKLSHSSQEDRQEGRERRGRTSWPQYRNTWVEEGQPHPPGSPTHPAGVRLVRPQRILLPSPGSSVVRLVPARWPSPLLSLVPGTLEPGPGLPVGQTDKVQGALGRGGGEVAQPAGVFRVGEWQQGESLTGPVVADEGVPLAMGVKATGLWVDFGAFSWAGSSSSMWRSSGLRC